MTYKRREREGIMGSWVLDADDRRRRRTGLSLGPQAQILSEMNSSSRAGSSETDLPTSIVE